MTKRACLPLTAKDLPILRFLWWWKISSTAAIVGRFSMEYQWDAYTVHWRLNRLKHRGYVAMILANQARGVLWTLTHQGFKAIESELPKLRERGSGSENPAHDHLVQAVHLGEWLPRGSAPGVKLFSEQELRRIDPDCYPEWIPQDTEHRPDGYWRIPVAEGARVVALEVELSAKSLEDYQKTMSFYNRTREIHAVLWVISGGSLAKKITRAGEEGHLRFRDIHSFVNLADFKTDGWNAKIFLGREAGHNVCEFLTRGSSLHPPCKLPASPVHAWTPAILDTRLFRVKSTTQATRDSAKNPDCMSMPRQNECPKPNSNQKGDPS